MRLGCEATAVDINPVAWFILKCTLEYPQRLAGKKLPLPAFILEDEDFMEAFYKANPESVGRGKATKKQKQTLFVDQDATHAPRADLAWHVRAWGRWVLKRARKDLASHYPTYADFEPLKIGKPYEPQPMRLVPLDANGVADVATLNREFSPEYLEDRANPRWVAKPTVAYLWARTVACKNCRAELPLLKTRWLCKHEKHRVVLTMEPASDRTRVEFSIQADVPVKGGNAAQKREHDKRLSAGTMSRSGATCPCCGAIMTMEDIRVEGRAGRMGTRMLAVACESATSKLFRLPTDEELAAVTRASAGLADVFDEIPFGLPLEPMASEQALGMRVQLYGLDTWNKLFTGRQLFALGHVVQSTLAARDGLKEQGCPDDWAEAISAYLTLAVGRTANYLSSICIWDSGAAEVKQTFLRFALPMTWDFAEANPMSPADRYYVGGLSKIAKVIDQLLPAAASSPPTLVVNRSAIRGLDTKFELVVTDPPYYDAIPYSDLMDFFYIWFRRCLQGLSAETDKVFSHRLAPKWDHAEADGELVDDSSRHGNDAAKSKKAYEDGMAAAFTRCAESLVPDGRMVIVFANKQPAAWETLVSAVIRAGFTVDGSWPIATEMRGGVRNFARASLASSVWLVCKKRPSSAKAGWDTAVLEEMQENISKKLKAYWDAGIRGPDFIWAATGPALEAYSKHPVVKKADEPGKLMTVAEFLNSVRRIVVDFVVGRVLDGDESGELESAAADRLDEPTAYYLLHRRTFGLDQAPAGACILYAVSCGLSDAELANTWDLLAKTGAAGTAADDDDDDDDNDKSDTDAEESGSAGGKVRLKSWTQRKGKSLGYEAPSGRAVPIIDRIHRLMHLWKAGDVHKVDDFLDEHGLRRHELFKRVIQSLIELATEGGEENEKKILESLSNHIGIRGQRTRKNLSLLEDSVEPADVAAADVAEA